jgi:hypothetical protein
MFSWFRKVTFTCNHCCVVQRIPLRRVHFFERFHELGNGQPVLIRCPQCVDGLQIPNAYTSHTGHSVLVDPRDPPREAFIHEAVC